MKHALNRIEANLHRSEIASTASKPRSVVAKKRIYSFEIRRSSQKRDPSEEAIDDSPTQNLGATLSKFPTLPSFKSSSDSCDRSIINPASNTNQTQATPIDVASCEAKLRQIVEQIENLYLEGPIVDGWLESHSLVSEPLAATSDSGTVTRQLERGEEFGSSQPETVASDLPRFSYCLCGLDAAGQKWSHPCPLEQLPSVSMAIARYQKLQQLLKHMQYWETRLKQGSRGSHE